MRSITIKVAAGTSENLAERGDYVRIKTASVAVRIQTEDRSVDATIEQGDALNLKQFNALRVSHSDAADQTITLLIGNGTSSDSARVGGSVDVNSLPSRAVAVTSSNVFPVGASEQLFAANTARKFLSITNNSTADAFINIAGAAAAAGQGIKLTGGATVIFDNFVPAGAINVYSSLADIFGFQG